MALQSYRQDCTSGASCAMKSASAEISMVGCGGSAGLDGPVESFYTGAIKLYTSLATLTMISCDAK